jgi:hypothetical protein
MSTPLFNLSEMHVLNDTHKNAIAEMLRERYTPFVAENVKNFAEDIRDRQSLIMENLKSVLAAVPESKEFWAKTISFYSNVYERGMPHRADDNNTYQIWAYTDFRTRLLEELQLDPKKFSFKLTSQYIKNVDVGVAEYYNTLMLVYRP